MLSLPIRNVNSWEISFPILGWPVPGLIETQFGPITYPFWCAHKVAASLAAGDSSRRRIHWFIVAPPVKYRRQQLLTKIIPFAGRGTLLQKLQDCWSSALSLLPFNGWQGCANNSYSSGGRFDGTWCGRFSEGS